MTEKMVEEKNTSRNIGIALFILGVLSMHGLVITNFWLIVIGIIPPMTMWGIIPAMSTLGILTWGLGVPAGVMLMVIGGLIYGRRTEEGNE